MIQAVACLCFGNINLHITQFGPYWTKCVNDISNELFYHGLLCWSLLWFGTNQSWWRHQMETFSALLTLCAGNLPVTGEFPTQRPLTRSFGVFFDLHLNKQLSKQSSGWWIEKPSLPLWGDSNVSHISPRVISLTLGQSLTIVPVRSNLEEYV